MRDKSNTPAKTLSLARRIARDNGVRYAYTGNVHDGRGGSTYCHECDAQLIGRDWYEMTHWALDDAGRCNQCNSPCAGVFDGRPGDWGSKRMPIRLSFT